MTAHALSGDRERFLDAGFDGYISKPFRESDLVGEVLRLLAPVRAARVAKLSAPPLPEAQFSIEALCDIFGRNETLVRQVIGAFLAVRTSLHQRLVEARARRDGEPLRKVAHEIKGMTGMMGAKRLQALAAALEVAARKAAWDEVEALSAPFESEWLHVTACVEAYASEH
ncbi:MAG TPA: Hpt domain-containing protein, partial [Burkholderiaceae bacterium]|nr:Hpt domain-containing protein [Burkholderiaceae bacterium]